MNVRLSLAAVLAAAAAAPPAFGDIPIWEEEGTRPGRARSLSLDGYVQPGFVHRQNDEQNVAAPGQPERWVQFNPYPDDHFWLQRARFGFKAKLHEQVRLRVEYDATVSQLQDGWLEYRPHQAFGLRAGQMQIPFLRTFLFGELHLGFIDRTVYVPLQNDREALRFLKPRDVGAMVLGRVGDTTEGATSPVLEYWAGVFNGNQQITNNSDDVYLFAARLQVHALGLPRAVADENDLARNEHPKLAIAAGAYTNCDDRAQWNRGLTGDLEARWRGLYASTSVVWFRNGAARGGFAEALGYDGSPTYPACGTEYRTDPPPTHIASGWSAQVQYALPTSVTSEDDTVELLVRADQVNPQSPCSDPSKYPAGSPERSQAGCPIFGGDDSTTGYLVPAAFDDSDNPPSRLRFTFGVNWFPTSEQRMRVSFNYMMNRETETVQRTEGEVNAIKNDVLWLQATMGF